MSNAGRGKPHIPGIRMNAPNLPNGRTVYVPPDLEWDADNPPEIYSCSMNVTHHPSCSGSCGEPIKLDSELQVALLNEARAYARAEMSFMGVPTAYAGVIPIPGMQVELFDVLIWLQTIKEIIIEAGLTSAFDFDERFRALKLKVMQDTRKVNEDAIRKRHLADKFGIPHNPIIGPDGNAIS